MAALPSLTRRLNDQLQTGVCGTYGFVQGLVIYWEEAAEAYKKEAREVKTLLVDDLGYSVTEFAIPSDDSDLALEGFVLQKIREVNQLCKENLFPVLMVVFYSGHGDEDDEDGERRSIWAAFDVDGPTVNWSDIQPKLFRSQADVLIILDCCYAAQAARATKKPAANVELLAASAMRVQTPAPGKRSFTHALLKEVRQYLAEGETMTVSELHTRLANRKTGLFATPVHFTLQGNRDKGGIRIGRLSLEKKKVYTDFMVGGSTLCLSVSTRSPIGDTDLAEISRWLLTNIPEAVSALEVDGIVETTSRMSSVVRRLGSRDDILPRILDTPAQTDIMSSWDRITDLVAAYTFQPHKEESASERIQIVQQRAQTLLEKLREYNEKLQELVKHKLLLSSELNDQNLLDQAIDDSLCIRLGLKQTLGLKRTIRSNDVSTGQPQFDRCITNHSCEQPLLEYKYYTTASSLEDVAMSTRRVELLANILSASKGPEFRCPPFLGWYHEPDLYRFALVFQRPEGATPELVTLHEAITNTKRQSRPTLGERFTMAAMITRGLLNWHIVDWVHQGVSSRDIFFTYDASGRLKYTAPYLGGFDYSRPNVAPSLGTYVDHIDDNIYRHPDRQGPSRHGHRKKHDIYSLGVVLLEIGLWLPALSILPSKRIDSINAKEMKDALVNAATDRLAHYAGRGYQAATLACLQSEFGVHLDDDLESHLIKAFESMVVCKLDKCLVIS